MKLSQLKFFLTLLRSVSDSSLLSITGWSGQLFRSLIHTGHSHQFCPSLPISHPLLPKSAGFCFVGTYLQFIKPCSFYLSYSIRNKYFVFNQCKITVLSDHANTSPILNFLRLHFTFPAKCEDIWEARSRSCGIDIFFLANRDLLVIRLWLTLFGW